MRDSDAFPELVEAISGFQRSEEIADEIIAQSRLLGAVLFERGEYEMAIVGMVDAGATADHMLGALELAGLVEVSRVSRSVRRVVSWLRPRAIQYERRPHIP